MPRIDAVFLVALLLLMVRSTHAELFINEVMTSNATSLEDGDGDTPDWLELTYSGPDAFINIDGWYLTDDPANLAKWRCPAVDIPRFGFLIVFCSGKDRNDPTAELHTNFGLNDRGEYLALVRPDETVAMSFSPTLPRLIQDGSFGLESGVVESTAIHAGDTGRVLIPIDNSLGTSWTALVFDDTGWTEGPSGFGFDGKFPTTYTEIIGTDVRVAMRGNSPSAYIRMPFDLVSPGDVDFLRVRAQYGDGFVAYINGQKILSVDAPDNPQWNTVATAVRFPNDVLSFEEFDVSMDGFPDLLVMGTNVLAIHGLNNHVNNNDFVIVPELIAIATTGIDVNSRRYFEPASPGRPNGSGYATLAATPTASVPSGVYVTQVNVELSTPSNTAEIRLTRDGTIPTATDELYDGAIVLTETTALTARAFEPGSAPSALMIESYTILDSGLESFDSDLPLVVVETFGEQPGNLHVRGQMHVLDRSTDGRTRLTNTPDFSGRIGIKTRGSSSAEWPKKSFNIETRDVHDGDLDVRFLDFSLESDWVLFGSHLIDWSMLHNPVVYGLSDRMGRWAPGTQPAELFLSRNGDGVISSTDYYGVIHIMEKIKRDPNRVAIADLEPAENSEPEISGGYILKIDARDADETSIRGDLLVTDPPADELTSDQKDWITDYVDDFESALFGPNPSHPDTGYPAYIDEDSFVDLHIIDQITKNIDTNIRSVYMYKDRNGKIFRGPTWDHDRAFGTSGEKPDSFSETADVRARSGWWSILMFNNRFLERYELRWSEFRQGPLDIDDLLAEIDHEASLIEEAQVRDYDKWRTVPDSRAPSPSTWRSTVARFKNFTRARILFMDGAYLFVPVLSPAGSDVSPPLDVTMTITTGPGAVYYTLNGPDPMTELETVAPGARLYGAAVPITANTRIRARARVDGRWSALVEEVYVVDPPTLAITEMMYNPPGSELFEFLEVQNFGSSSQTIAGVSFGGIDFNFDSAPFTTLGPGEIAVIVNDLTSFASLYDLTGIRLAGAYEGNLKNEGEEITVLGPLSEPIARFRYSPYWYPETNGGGRSLELVDPTSSPDTWGDAEAWQPSAEDFGSPGHGGTSPVVFRRGDVVPDGVVAINDPITILLYQFDGPLFPPCLDALDFNDNGQIQIDDALGSLFFQFAGATPPADPGAATCGPDPTADSLGCETYPEALCP